MLKKSGKLKDISILLEGQDEAVKTINALAQSFMAGPENDLRMPGGPEPAFGPPLLASAAGDDPIWERIKSVVHPQHLLPLEAFTRAFSQSQALASDLSVLVFVLPQTEATRGDQRKASDFPSQRWARSRFLGQPQVVDGLARHLQTGLAALGIEAMVPDHLPGFAHLAEGGPYGLASPWSHRHAAFAAGLGTFGLCDGLITPVGKSVRLGSLIIRHKLSHRVRPYEGYRDYCSFSPSGSCGRCIGRCPIGAISEKGHDKAACAAWTLEASREGIARRWPEIAGGYSCGLCQVGVPCEKAIPPARKIAQG
jgi:hypothetical protein